MNNYSYRRIIIISVAAWPSLHSLTLFPHLVRSACRNFDKEDGLPQTDRTPNELKLRENIAVIHKFDKSDERRIRLCAIAFFASQSI